MATLNIGGTKVIVSDDFLRLTPEQQQATVEEIAANLGPSPGNVPNPSPEMQESLGRASQASQKFAGPIAPRNVPQPTRPDLIGSTAATLGGLVQGVPVIGPMAQNVSDALVGAGAQLTGGDYSATVQGLQERRQALADANPIANVAGNLAGGFGAYGALAKTVGGAQALGLAGSMPARFGNSAASGSAIAATDAMFRGGDLNQALQAGLVGGAIGAVAPPITAGLGMAARAIGNKIAPTVAGARNPIQEGSRRAGQVFARDAQLNPGNVMNAADEAMARQAGVPLMNVDRGGETTRALARSVANQNPEARSIITKAADERFESQGLRAVEFIKRLTGGRADDLAFQDQLKKTAQLTNAPRYRAAYDAPQARAIWTPEIRNLMQAGPFRTAIQQAESTAKNAAAVSGQRAVVNPFVFGADGSITLRTMPDGSRALPNLEFWDIVQRNLRNQADMASRQGDNLLASQIGDMRRQLNTVLDTAVPQFQMARAGAAAFFGADDALEAGKKFATQPRNVPEAQRAFAAFSDAEKQAFQTGYASELIDRIRSTRDRVNVINQIFGSQSSREMAELVFGSAKAKQLEAYVRVENLADMIRGALGNSTTARQLVELGIGTGIGGVGGFTLSGGNMGSAVQGAALGAGAAGARALGQRIDAKVMQEVARILTSSNPQDLQKAIYNASLSPKWMDAIKALEQQLQIAARVAPLPIAAGQN